MRGVLTALVAAAVLATGSHAVESRDPGDTQAGVWRRLGPGLEFASFPSPRAADPPSAMFRVLRIDPRFNDFVLVNASAAGDKRARTAKEWCRREGLTAAINPSMYQEDHLTSVSLMRSPAHVNNGHLTRDKAILAFDPLEPELPRVRIIDRECDDEDALMESYGTLVQSIRMISCRGRNVWAPQPKRWSAAVVAVDETGRALFIHVRHPYRMHDLINILQELPLHIRNAMYAEGGPEAQLYVKSGDVEMELFGSFEPGFLESDGNLHAWPIPNVIGIRPREKTGESETGAAQDQG
ncbi:MAG: phosphodiester glycosidase family protein [Candidatus Eisenbacteria bacterium]|nr:phosphodiester glycosidase family protein [Candidatus Eisenbacteria bacterium]